MKNMSHPLVLRLLAASVNVTSRAGAIIRDILSKGDLGIIEKVSECHAICMGDN